MIKLQMLHNLLPQQISDETAFHLSNTLQACALYLETHYQSQIKNHVQILDVQHRCDAEEEDIDATIPFFNAGEV